MRVQLLIEMAEDGRVSINGPIDNKVLCYGLLDCAKDAIRQFNEKRAEQKIETPPLVLAPSNGRF